MSDQSQRKYGFEPIIDDASRVLILGTLPGEQSLAANQYYIHGQNSFWKVLARVFDDEVGDEREAFLERHHVAVWDVLHSAVRNDSASDKEIIDPMPNDFSQLFATYPNLKTIAFNGKKASEYFEKLVLKQQSIDVSAFRTGVLISTSAAAARTLEDKVESWKSLLK